MNTKQIIFIVASSILLSACDVGRGLLNNFRSYSEPNTLNTARIRFVSTADDVRLYSNTTCASVKTDAGSVFYRGSKTFRSIDMPLPESVPKPYVEYYVPANEPLVVNFHKRYPWGNGQLFCNLLITFTPEKNKDYQLQLLAEQSQQGFFKANKNICYIKADEIVDTKNGYRLQTLPVKTTDFCRGHHF